MTVKDSLENFMRLSWLDTSKLRDLGAGNVSHGEKPKWASGGYLWGTTPTKAASEAPFPMGTCFSANHLDDFNSARLVPCEQRIRQRSGTQSGTLSGV